MLTDPDDAALSEAIIAIAAALRLECVAEGVETRAQADFLMARGCPYLQGYFFGSPLGAEEFPRLLHRSEEQGRRAQPG